MEKPGLTGPERVAHLELARGRQRSRQETCPVLSLHPKGLEKVPLCRLPGPKGLNGCEPRSLARQTLLPSPG